MDYYRCWDGKFRVLIFNHTKFLNTNIQVRPPEIGVKLENFFSKREYFEVSHFYDLTKGEVAQELVKVSNEGEKYSAVIVCISSHGNLIEDEDKVFYEIIHAQDGPYYKTDLWKHFKDKEGWKGKPKLFFIQACRGEDPTAGVLLSHDTPEKSEKMFTELRYPDLFIMNASQQGTVSWRTSNGGSLFFDALTIIFKKSHMWDLLTMALEISNRVARNFEVCSHLLQPSLEPNKYECCQQMPCFETTLTKKFYFPDVMFSGSYFRSKPEKLMHGMHFYENVQKPLAIVLNYSYEGTRYPSNKAKARANKNVLKIGLATAGFTYENFWDVSKWNLPRLLKAKYESNNKDMILVIFNGYGERDELYLNDEKIKVYELWEPLLPNVGEQSSGKPKIILISASPPNPTLEGVSGKIDKLCEPPTDRNVKKCVFKLDKGQVNVPRTADLLVCYETAAARTNYKLAKFIGSPFIKMFSDELMDEDNEDFFCLIQKIVRNFSSDKSFNEQVPFAFSTLRKLAPVRCKNEPTVLRRCQICQSVPSQSNMILETIEIQQKLDDDKSKKEKKLNEVKEPKEKEPKDKKPSKTFVRVYKYDTQ